jgi:hypothetical protein
MARFCDATPCLGLLQALVKGYVWGEVVPQKRYFMQWSTRDGARGVQQIEYCPFCGTRLGFTDEDQMHKWLRPPQATPPPTRQLRLIWYKNGHNHAAHPEEELSVSSIAYS